MLVAAEVDGVVETSWVDGRGGAGGGGEVNPNALDVDSICCCCCCIGGKEGKALLALCC